MDMPVATTSSSSVATTDEFLIAGFFHHHQRLANGMTGAALNHRLAPNYSNLGIGAHFANC
jgi:hypothetical protein